MDPESPTEVESNDDVKLPTSESNSVKFGLEIEEPTPKETDTLLSGVVKVTRFGLPRLGWYWDNYVWNALSAALSLSIVNCMVKLLSNKYSVFEIALVRSILCSVIFAMTSYHQKLPLFGPANMRRLLIARGTVGGCGFISTALATVLLPISESAFVTSVYPAVVAFVSWILAMEELSWISWTGIVGTILGNALVAHPPFIFGGHEEWGATRLLGILIAILANLFIAIAYFIIGKIGTSVSTTTMSFYQSLCTSFISLCLLIGYPKKLQFQCSAVEAILLLGVGLASVVNQVSLTRALQIGPPTKSVMLFMTSMLWSSAFGVVVLSERITWVSATGSLIILASVLAVASQKQKSQN